MKQNIPVPRPLADGRTITRDQMKHVRIDDEEKAPILVHFAGCNELIAEQLEEEWVPDTPDTTNADASDKDARQVDQVEQLVAGRQKRDGQWGTWQTTGAGTVLVHCQAGCSRSVAIVAAYLMQTRRISAVTAVSMLRKRRKDAESNKGFMAQLELYEQVGYEIDMKWQAVRRFLMSKTDILNGDSMDDMLLSYYPSPMLKSPTCSSYFIEPMAWMSDLSGGQVTGRLNCPSPKCGVKLGSWDWAGMQCGCGSWVTPAFALHRSKVDEI
ncbi:hypothetical protein NDA16_003828 [Ustilago loliicola]|nr:hypothetical protein NDA16_003828 [Ustilago loliicola]